VARSITFLNCRLKAAYILLAVYELANERKIFGVLGLVSKKNISPGNEENRRRRVLLLQQYNNIISTAATFLFLWLHIIDDK